MFAVKDLSSLNMLGKNLGDAVQTQFRNDLQLANMERENVKKREIQSTLSLFDSALKDESLSYDQKRQAKIGAMNKMIGLDANPKFVDLVGEMLPEEKPVNLQFDRGGAGDQPIIFDPRKGMVTPSGNINPVRPEWRASGKTIHEDGIVKKEMRAYNPTTGEELPDIKPHLEPWQRENDWIEKFNAMLDARGLVEVKKRTKELINKARPLDQKSRYFQDLLDTKTIGLIGKPSEDEIAQEKARITALKNSVDQELSGYRSELSDIETDYGSEMINNPSGKTAGVQRPTVEVQKPPQQDKGKINPKGMSVSAYRNMYKDNSQVGSASDDEIRQLLKTENNWNGE